MGADEAEGGGDDHTVFWGICQLLFRGHNDEETRGRSSGESKEGWTLDLHRLQRNEERLVTQGLAVARIALAQLVDAIRATNEDQDRCERQEGDKVPKSPRQSLGHPHAAAAEGVVEAQGDKCCERDDLEDQAGQSDVDARLAGAVGRRGHGAARGLQDQAEHVACDEDVVVVVGWEARVRRGDVLDSVIAIEKSASVRLKQEWCLSRDRAYIWVSIT